MCLLNPAHPRVLHGRWYKVRMSHKDAIVSLMGTYSYISQWYSIFSDLKRHMSYLSSLVRHKKLYKSMVYLLTLLFTTSTVKQLYCSTVASGGAPVNDLVWFELLLTNKDETVFHEHCSIVTKLLQITDRQYEIFAILRRSISRSLYAISRPSVVCLLSVCLSSVCDVGAPYSGGWTFRQFFFTIR